MKEKRGDNVGDFPLTSASAVFLLCVLFVHSSSHLPVGLCLILMWWYFTAILVLVCSSNQCNTLQLLASLKMSLELRLQLKGSHPRLKKRHFDCTDQSSILFAMLAHCHRL